jgi:SAM-dependent methyltransferase
VFSDATKINRSDLYDVLPREVIVARYKRKFGVSTVCFAQVQRHAELERELTDRILSSAPAKRAQITSEAYSTLYSEIDWLTDTGGDPDGRRWRALLRDNAEVYEIGSGAGKLAMYLNMNGISCVRTDISAERNAKNEFGETMVTDGVNLSAFVDQKYDFVISDQVVEHLHPEDIITHFSEARAILKPGGSYIFRAPNARCGPHDLSWVLGFDKAIFMHLSEFTWHDVVLITKPCGFTSAKAILTLPGTKFAMPSGLYFNYLTFIEKTFALNKSFRKLAKFLYFPSQVWVKLGTD